MVGTSVRSSFPNHNLILSLVPRSFVAVDDTLVGTCLVAPRAWEVRKTLDDDKALAAAL